MSISLCSNTQTKSVDTQPFLRRPFSEADSDSARQGLARLRGRPQLICSESPIDGTRRHLESTGVAGDFTFVETGFRNHNDAWILRPSAARDAASKWLAGVVNKPQQDRAAPMHSDPP